LGQIKNNTVSIQNAYNKWALQYDTNINATRDLEATALRTMLRAIQVDRCLEMGCGTGKNTMWLMEKAAHVTAVDFSPEMLDLARQKISSDRVTFIQADISKSWNFLNERYQLISFSLVLEHIADLDPIFGEAAKWIDPNGYMYIGELHPFKQYTGSKARFNTEKGEEVLECYNHHISDFMNAARRNDWHLLEIEEFFDDPQERNLPRLLTLIFQK